MTHRTRQPGVRELRGTTASSRPGITCAGNPARRCSFPFSLLTIATFALLTLGGCGGSGDGLDPIPGIPSGGSASGAGGAGSGGTGGSSGGGSTPPNNAPTSSLTVQPAGPYAPGDVVMLDASSSADPDGDSLSFSWSQPSGPTAAISPPDGSVVLVTMPLVVDASQLQIRVTVSDGRGGTAESEASFSIQVAAQFAGWSQSALPYRDQLTRDEAYHLLRRAAFGARPDEVALAVQRGLAATLDDLFTTRETPAAVEQFAQSCYDDIQRRWMIHMVEGPNPLREQMALFWHDRFATSRRFLGQVDRPLAIRHWNMLRNGCLGNYRQLLRDVTADDLMLFWLDGSTSLISKPNENYAREFWELFTLGRDVIYTEQDIREAARGFTGFHVVREHPDQPAQTPWSPEFHDPGVMSIFPARAAPRNFDYRDIIDLTLAQPEAARFVARNLFTAFIHENPSDAVIQELADLFTASNYEIAPLMRRVLSCQAFFSEEARGALMTSPVEHWVGVARTLDMHIHSPESRGQRFTNVAAYLKFAGQELLNPTTVFGWQEGLGWVDDQGILLRVYALTERMEFGPARTPLMPLHLLPPQSEWASPAVKTQIVDGMAAVFHLELLPEERDIYLQMLTVPDPEHVSDVIKLMSVDERVLTR